MSSFQSFTRHLVPWKVEFRCFARMMGRWRATLTHTPTFFGVQFLPSLILYLFLLRRNPFFGGGTSLIKTQNKRLKMMPLHINNLTAAYHVTWENHVLFNSI